MIWLRRGFLAFLSLMMLSCLLGAMSSLGVKNAFSNPENIKTWVADSKLFDHLVLATLEQAQKSANKNNDAGTVSLDDPEVQEAAQAAFTPELLQTSFNTFIDSNYAWLNGKTATPGFSINLASAKEQFATQVGKYVETRLAGLPVCTPEQLATIPIPADPLSVPCRPSLLDPKTEGARVTEELNDGGEFLKDPVVTAETLGQEADGTPSQPYDQEFPQAPQAYKASLHAPWILGGLALLCTVGIIFVSASHRRGWGLVGIILAIAGSTLITIRLLSDMLMNKFDARIENYVASNQLEQPINYLLNKFEPALLGHYLGFGLAFLAIAVVIFVWLFKTRDGKPKPAAPIKPETPAPPVPQFDEPSPTPPLKSSKDSASKRLAPKRSRQPGAAPAAGKTLGKNPPRRKPPRLVQ